MCLQRKSLLEPRRSKMRPTLFGELFFHQLVKNGHMLLSHLQTLFFKKETFWRHLVLRSEL